MVQWIYSRERKETEMTEQKQIKIDKWEIAGYAGLALTIAGQILVGVVYLAGAGCWFVANLLYLTKAAKQDLGKAEIVRNVCMSAITAGLAILSIWGVF